MSQKYSLLIIINGIRYKKILKYFYILKKNVRSYIAARNTIINGSLINFNAVVRAVVNGGSEMGITRLRSVTAFKFKAKKLEITFLIFSIILKKLSSASLEQEINSVLLPSVVLGLSHK